MCIVAWQESDAWSGFPASDLGLTAVAYSVPKADAATKKKVNWRRSPLFF